MANIIKNNDMIFDETRKRYRLTKDYVKNELGMDLQNILYDEFDANPTTLPDRTIKYTSDMIYDYMKRVSADYNYACELINTVPEINYAFRDALGYQLMSFVQEGDKAFSADGTMEQSICPRSLQILNGYKLLTSQKIRIPKYMSQNMIWNIQDDWADRGGGIF